LHRIYLDSVSAIRGPISRVIRSESWQR
jgi:hypothetical protein